MHIRRPSASLVVATVAVVVAGSGSAVAAGLITSAKIQNGTIQLVDISAKAKKSLKGAKGPAGAAGHNGANGTNGTNGAPGAAGAPGSALAYARVTWYLPTTTHPGFVPGYTKGFTDVTRTSSGRYCLTPEAGLDLANKPVLVSLDWAQTVDPVGNASASWLTAAPECPAPKIGVETMRIPHTGGDAVIDDQTSFTIMVP
jgi:hypothetical protein